MFTDLSKEELEKVYRGRHQKSELQELREFNSRRPEDIRLTFEEEEPEIEEVEI